MQQVASADNFNRVTGVFAYATESGVRLLIDALSGGMPPGRWMGARKRWIVSIDFGRTEPKALELLASLERSEVLIPNYEEVINQRLIPKSCFHAKTLIFDTEAGLEGGPGGLVIGSANLTVSGLSLGHEHAIAIIWESALNAAMKRQIGSLRKETRQIDALFNVATPINAILVQRYARMRSQRVLASEDDNPNMRLLTEDSPEIPLTRAAILATASNLWVDVDYVVQNRGRGRPGNQIDLPRGTRVFFGFGIGYVPRNTHLGTLIIRYGGNSVRRNMRFGNNDMDKLNLPVPGVEGPANYENQTLLFQHQSDGTFLLRIGTPQQRRRWKEIPRAQGTLFTMQGGREYGVFN